jgi:glutamate dehydrogenase (NAD(P)+)
MTAPSMSLTWTHVTGRQGFLVVDRLVRGVCSGGLSMRAGCTLDEVAGPARGMTTKEALQCTRRRPGNRGWRAPR